MIRYALKCPEGHRFESWFQNAAAFDALAAGGRVSCPDCGATGVEKCLMTPDVRTASAEAPTQAPAPGPAHPLAAGTAQERALAELRARVEAESDYVGTAFASEARAIHAGEAPERQIYGEARLEEAVALIEDGVPIAPLPFTPTRKTN